MMSMSRFWRRQFNWFLVLCMCLGGLSGVHASAPPNIVTYQGRVLNTNGVPVSDSSVDMKFFLYTASAGGTCLWSNSSADCDSDTPGSTTARSVTLSTGLFTQNLGDTSDSFAAIADSVFADNTSIYLEVIIEGETLSPRRRVTAAPYALNAQRLDGVDSTGFLASDGDTATGIYDFSGSVWSGASPIVFEGATADDFETSFSFVDPTADRTITFQNGSGTVAFTSDITGGLWEDGTNGVYEDDEAVIVGTDVAFTYGTGGVGDLQVADELEVLGDGYFDNDLVVGASTSSTETLSHSSFSLGGDDLFVAGTLGVEGVIYTDGGFTAGTTTTFGAGAITTTGTTDLSLTIAGGDLTFAQATTIGDGADALTINSSGTLTIDDTAVAFTGAGTISSAASSAITLNADSGNAAGEDLIVTTNNVSLTAAGALSLTPDAAVTTAITLIDTDYTNALSIGDNNITGTSYTLAGTAAAIDFSEFDVAAATGSITINDDGDAGQVSIEGTVLDINSLIFAGSGAVTSTGVADLVFTSGQDITFDDDNLTAAIPLSLADANLDNFAAGDRAIIDALNYLEANIGGGGGLFTDDGTIAYLTTTTDDIAVGGTTLASAFSVDVSGNLVRVGDGADADGQIDIYASNGASGSLSWATGDYLAVGGGGFTVDNWLTPTDPLGDDARTPIHGTISPGGSLGADTNHYGTLAQVSSSADLNGNVYSVNGVMGVGTWASEASGGPTLTTGVRGLGLIQSASQTAPFASGLYGSVRSVFAGGTITSAYGAYGDVTAGPGTITTGYGGHFENTAGGTTRIGVSGTASGGTNNRAAHFYGAAVWIDDDSDPTDDTPDAATGAGDLFVADDLEVDGTTTITFAAGGSFALCHATNGAGSEAITDCTAGPTADYAEQYSVEEGIEYGDIVVPGSETVVTTEGDTIAKLTKSSQPYQGPVVGIVSNNYGDFTSAGYNIKDEDNPMPIALVGRVPVKVTNEGGLIQAGDYLTTSSTAGMAMKAQGVGRVIGMALEDWNGETPTVMVQVHNSWTMGDVIGTDGTSTTITDNVVVSALGSADEDQPTFDSYGLALRGSAWGEDETVAVDMLLKTVVDSEDEYRLSVRNTQETEVAYITNEGTMRIAGDMVVAGRIYPSDRGTAQTEKYIYYDGSSGAGGDFMRTNAKGWSTGSYDFAEMFPSDQPLTAGDIVAFSGSGESVHRAGTQEDERLAGIVSTRPGFLAGENVEGAYPIALAGRVPTRVNLENGVIAVGDALTSSSQPGTAMKATDPGEIVGYALEAYSSESSDNLILAYVNVGYWSGSDVTPIVNNQASEVSSASNFSTLNMGGNIYMATHQILGIGRLEGIGALWSVESDGTIKTEGLLKTVIDSYQQKKVETIAVTSPEALITLSGTATLVNGQAEIRFEDVIEEYNDVISAIAPIRVLVTPNGPVSLYVSEKDQNHFTVVRFAGSADVEFDWMVTAYRKGFEPEEEDEQETSVDESNTDTEQTGTNISEETNEEVGSIVEEEANSEEEITTEDESVVEDEPATPESPDEPLIDSPIEDVIQESEKSDVVDEPDVAEEVTESESETSEGGVSAE